ncbi:phosphotransferase [Alteromonas sp. CYL-A6]|uniref:phosphotransferase n=1 Tax=Alteromonas nitratireducens TaxID=3390813 RepID=UPI0034B92821
MDPRSIITLLKDRLNLQEPVTLESQASGTVNSVFKLYDAQQAFAVKWVGEDTFSGIDRFHQFVLQEQLARRGMAPRPVWLSDDGRLWVEVWVNTACVPVETDVVYTLASVLAHIHNQPVTARPLNLEARWEHYIEVAGLDAASALVKQADQLRPRLRASQSSTNDLVLCHNDLSYGHIIDQQHHIVVDWEYSAMGNRFFDLASCVMINDLSERQSERLCFYYAEQAGLPLHQVTRALAVQSDIVALTNELWQSALDASASQALSPPVVL